MLAQRQELEAQTRTRQSRSPTPVAEDESREADEGEDLDQKWDRQLDAIRKASLEERWKAIREAGLTFLARTKKAVEAESDVNQTSEEARKEREEAETQVRLLSFPSYTLSPGHTKVVCCRA